MIQWEIVPCETANTFAAADWLGNFFRYSGRSIAAMNTICNHRLQAPHYKGLVPPLVTPAYSWGMGWEGWGTRLKAHMKGRKVTQDDIAEHMGVSQGAVAHWLKGRREVNLKDFFRVCEFVQADPQEILFGDEVQLPPQAILDRLQSLLQDKPAMKSMIAGRHATDEVVGKSIQRAPIPKAKRKRRRHPTATFSRRTRQHEKK